MLDKATDLLVELNIEKHSPIHIGTLQEKFLKHPKFESSLDQKSLNFCRILHQIVDGYY